MEEVCPVPENSSSQTRPILIAAGVDCKAIAWFASGCCLVGNSRENHGCGGKQFPCRYARICRALGHADKFPSIDVGLPTPCRKLKALA